MERVSAASRHERLYQLVDVFCAFVKDLNTICAARALPGARAVHGPGPRNKAKGIYFSILGAWLEDEPRGGVIRGDVQRESWPGIGSRTSELPSRGEPY